MFLKSVKISNFKCIKECNLDFDPQFNLIIGDNGIGKTSILEAISVALGGFLAGVEGVKTLHFTTDEIRRETELLGQGSYNIKYKTPVLVEANCEIDGETYTWIRRKRSKTSSRSTVEPRTICKKAMKLANDSNAILPVITYQSAARMWSQKRDKWENVFSGDFSRVIGYTDCLSEASNTKMLTNWCKRMEQISWQEDMQIAEYESVKTAVATFMNSMHENDVSRVYYDKKSEELMYSAGAVNLPIRLLSAGYRSLIGMVMDIAYRMSILNPNLLNNAFKRTTGVVLIDELDLHLHPKWQWNIVKSLKSTFPNVQFIVTTHSPIILASCQTEKLIMLKDGANGLLLMNQDTTLPKGWQVSDILKDLMETQDRDKSTKDKLNKLTELSRKLLFNCITDDEIQQYYSLASELKNLPESDASVDKATLAAMEQVNKEDG